MQTAQILTAAYAYCGAGLQGSASSPDTLIARIIEWVAPKFGRSYLAPASCR